MPTVIDPNLNDYEAVSRTFHWADVEKNFSWHESGKVNMAYEAIDRHAETWRKNKAAMIYTDGQTEKKYTFHEMKEETNRCADALQKIGIQKGERVFLFLPRSPELYISILGVIKAGAVAGPLFEAFMEQAVKDRLEDSEAVALITTPELLARIPYSELPDLKHIMLVGTDDVPESEAGTTFYSYDKEIAEADRTFEPAWVDREDGLVMHYSSGTTGKPKGITTRITR